MQFNPVPTNKVIAYSDDYWESAFLAWYQHGKPKGMRLIEVCPTDEFGRKPGLNVINAKINKARWRERAALLDEEVTKRIQQKAIEEKVAMLERQARFGEALQRKGFEYLEEHGLRKEETALRAIIQGAELERSSRGLPQALIKVAEMQDEQLGDMVQKLLSQVNPDEIDELSEELEREVVDVEYVEQEPQAEEPEAD